MSVALINLQQLQSICESAQGRGRCNIFLPHLNRFLAEFDIATPVRIAAFFGQVMQESGEFRYVRELGSDAYLDKYDTGVLAQRLGNTSADDNDGQKYRGHGLIQITGLANHRRCGKALGLDLVNRPELLEVPEYAVQSACWFWSDRRLNGLADNDNFRGITKIINGGYSHQDIRVRYWQRARNALGIGALSPATSAIEA
jgi:putative chitinase